MKNSIRRVRSLLLIMLCMILIVPGVSMHANAVTQKQRALAAYKRWLSTSKVCVIKKGSVYDGGEYGGPGYQGTRASQVKFGLAYIDNDDIPELVVYTRQGGYKGLYGILTYKRGRVYRYFSSYGEEALSGYYKKTGIFADRTYPRGEWIGYQVMYHKVTDNQDKYYLWKTYNPNLGKPWTFYNYSRKLTKNAFVTKLRIVTKNQQLLKVKFYNNTAANRNAKLR